MINFYRVLGLMSGTSLDGMDIAQCTFELEDGKWKYAIERAVTYPYSPEWKDRLSQAENLSGLDLMLLHNDFGSLSASFVNRFMEDCLVPVDFIASHGQTIFHQPHLGFTLQIGNGANIAAQTGITTVCDFRSLDVAFGGQGAPLVPIGDKLLFSEYDYCLNLGGFANVSYDTDSGQREAFDICPVNIVINHLVKERNLSYDPEGSLARNGVVCQPLLEELNQLDFYRQAGPKSLGKEWVLAQLLPIIYKYNLSLEDALHTFYKHIVVQCQNVIRGNRKNVLITGGGAHNQYIMELFCQHFEVEICVPTCEIIDFKEALIFAFLGLKRYRNENNCLNSVTGAKKDNCGGVIYLVE
ncbi:MAG: anhydro-N-acetylmuramic acid kinase [Bacteroidota bacterium]|nr:anhydro-N-acetylmuramic acid kinase [Bacteroidota bacterium]